jgi:sensor domain CHASE-containing protein
VFAHLLYRFKMLILKHLFSLKLLAALVALAIYIASLRINLSDPGEYFFTVHADVKWDLESAREQLLDRVHGQETAVQQLVDNLEWTRQQHKEVWDTANNSSSIRVIFLLGGPGVGKTEV